MTLGAEDFRKGRLEATAHVQIALSTNGIMPAAALIEGTAFRIFSDRSQTLRLGETIRVLRPVAGALDDWGPLTPPDDAAWARARYVEVYLRRDGDAWAIANGQLTLLRSGSTDPVNPAEAGGFGVTEGPGMRPLASTVASRMDQPTASAQTGVAAAESKTRDEAPPQRMDWDPVKEPGATQAGGSASRSSQRSSSRRS